MSFLKTLIPTASRFGLTSTDSFKDTGDESPVRVSGFRGLSKVFLLSFNYYSGFIKFRHKVISDLRSRADTKGRLIAFPHSPQACHLQRSMTCYLSESPDGVAFMLLWPWDKPEEVQTWFSCFELLSLKFCTIYYN